MAPQGDGSDSSSSYHAPGSPGVLPRRARTVRRGPRAGAGSRLKHILQQEAKDLQVGGTHA